MIFFEKLFAPTLGLSRGRDETCDVRAGGARAVTQLLLSACQRRDSPIRECWAVSVPLAEGVT
jgi:hypothetical protein